MCILHLLDHQSPDSQKKKHHGQSHVCHHVGLKDEGSDIFLEVHVGVVNGQDNVRAVVQAVSIVLETLALQAVKVQAPILDLSRSRRRARLLLSYFRR